jgi:hypothetical protein
MNTQHTQHVQHTNQQIEQNLLGMKYNDAFKYANEQGKALRVSMVNGRGLSCTEDFWTNRVNVGVTGVPGATGVNNWIDYSYMGNTPHPSFKDGVITTVSRWE